MRWRAISASLRQSHSASSSSANVNSRNRASLSTLASRRSLQGPSRSGTPFPSQEQARSSSHSVDIAKSGKTPSPNSSTVGNVCSAPIRSSTKTVAVSEDEDSSFRSGGPGASSQTCRSSKSIPLAEEKARLEAAKREAGRRETHSHVNIKPLEVSLAQVNASSKTFSAQVTLSERHGYEASASSPNYARGGSAMNAAKNSTSAVNWRNGEASASKVKEAGKINLPEDGFVPASTSKTSSLQGEGKAKSRVPSYKSPSTNAVHLSSTQVGERSVGVVDDAFDKRLESGIAVDSSGDITASSTNDTSECMLANGSSPHPKGNAALEERNEAEPKKASFAVSFPVTVFSDWWFSCYLQGHRPYYTSLNHPLNKVYVWLAAYQRVHFDVTGTYADAPSSAVLMKQLLDLLNAVLEGRFRWGDEKLVYLPTPVGHDEEPLSSVTTSPRFQDRVVHEILYLVLQPIFESRFSARSHGFRPGRDAHTALRAVHRLFQGCTWFISGNLSFLHQEKYASHLVDSALKVARDTRVTFLLKSRFLEDMSEQGGSAHACAFTDQGSCSKLRNLLCNAFLDQLDWFMDEQIASLSKKEQNSTQSSSNLLFKPEQVQVERLRKLEYIRYGTEIMVASNSTKEEAEIIVKSITSFFKQKFRMDVSNILTVSHISDGVKFLDHVISQKIVHPTISCRRASNGRVFKKQAHRIRLCIKASRESCLMYLKAIKQPTSSQHIEEMLLVLDDWYHYAENKEKVLQFCKVALCHLYAKGVVEKEKEGSMDITEQFKKAMCMVVHDQAKSVDSEKANLMPDFCWIPEHENVLREHTWLQSKSSMTEVTASFRNMRKVSPQQQMSQILWQYLGGSYASKGDNSWEPEVQMQNSGWDQEFMVDTKLDDFAESTG